MLCLWLPPPLVWICAKALAFCKFTIPLDSSWYARVTTGGATTMTPLYILNLPIQICSISKGITKASQTKNQVQSSDVISLWIHCRITSTCFKKAVESTADIPYSSECSACHTCGMSHRIASHHMQKLIRKITMRRNGIVATTPGLVGCFG